MFCSSSVLVLLCLMTKLFNIKASDKERKREKERERKEKIILALGHSRSHFFGGKIEKLFFWKMEKKLLLPPAVVVFFRSIWNQRCKATGNKWTSWSSGYGRKLTIRKSWVRIPATRYWIDHFSVVKIVLLFEKTENKFKRGLIWPILKRLTGRMLIMVHFSRCRCKLRHFINKEKIILWINPA